MSSTKVRIVQLAPIGEYEDVELHYDFDEHLFFNHYETMSAVQFIEKLTNLASQDTFADYELLTNALHDYYKHNAF